MGLEIFENEKTSEKSCVEIEDWGFSATFVLGFQENYIYTLYTYVLSKILKNGAKFIQKLSPGLKNHMRNLNNFRQAVESPINMLKFDGILSKKYIPLTKTYTEDLSNITFNYFCENSPNYSCHFRNPKSFFTTQLFCIFLAQTLHTFYKSSPSKCKFSDLSRYVETWDLSPWADTFFWLRSEDKAYMDF